MRFVTPQVQSPQIESLKASVRRLESHIGLPENGLDQAGSDEQGYFERVKSVIPDKAVVEVLLEYLLQECDWLWQCRDIVALWKLAITRSGIASPLAGLLCMSLCIPALFLGPYQTPFYRIPIDASKLHPTLFDTARTFLTGEKNLDELELLQVLLNYAVFTGRHDAVFEYTGKTMDIIMGGNWLDENSAVWRDLGNGARGRARLVVTEIVASYKWSLLMMGPDLLTGMRINICRPDRKTTVLQSPIRLDLPGVKDLPLRLFRVRSEDECHMVATYRELIRDFTDLIPEVSRLMAELPATTAYGDKWNSAVDRSYRLQQVMQEWREVKLPNAGMDLQPVDQASPLSCHTAARGVLLHHAVGCVEGILTRHWLTMGKFGSHTQQNLHDECLRNAQRAFDTIPTVRALLDTRHAPFVSTFIVCGLFNAATCFAIPLLRAVHVITDVHSLPAWPEEVIPTAPSIVNTGAAYNTAEIKQYANNILVILDVLAAFNALPCGKLAQDRLEALVQQFGVRGVQNPLSVDQTTLGMGMPEMMDPFPGMWDELLQLDTGVWEGLLGDGTFELNAVPGLVSHSSG